MAFVVETGVPMVSGKRGRKPTEFPLTEMDIGESFLIECDPTSKKEVDSWRRKLLNAKKRIEGGKFQTAIVEGGLRVWRTE